MSEHVLRLSKADDEGERDVICEGIYEVASVCPHLSSDIVIRYNNHERLVEALGKALEYIEQSPCDPDIYPEQLAAWGELTSLEPHKLLAQLEAGKGGE